MAVTKFGEAIRLARRNTEDTLATMSKELGKSVAFISAIETGRSRIPMNFVQDIQEFFLNKGYEFDEDLKILAQVENKNVPLDGLSVQQQMMVAGFANSRLSNEQIQKISSLLKQVTNDTESISEENYKYDSK